MYILLQKAMSQFAQTCADKDNDNPPNTGIIQPTRVEPKLINGPHLGRKIFRLGIPQIVCGILMACGMGLYVGVNLGEPNDYGDVYECRYILSHREFYHHYLPYAVPAIITSCLVRLILLISV